MEIKNIEHLLHNVLIIQEKYDSLAEITGEHYNVFDILGKRSDELSHSLILSNLLNAKGKHGQKDLFLKLFIEVIKSGFIEDEDKILFLESFDTKTSKSETEKFAGKIDFESGGRIDILISQGNRNIIIENKIYARDQNLQLTRYYNFDKEAPIIYLTLDGKDPSIESKTNIQNGQEYICISYQKEIIFWIEKCIEKMANKPMIRETLNQYLNLLKVITNQSINHNMSVEIKELIKKDFKSATEIVNNYEKAKIEICDKIREEVKSELELRIGEKYIITDGGSKVFQKNSRIFLELKEHQNLGVFFGIEPFSGIGNKGSELFAGILDNKKNNKAFFKEYTSKGSWWVKKIKFKTFEDYQIDFNNPDFLSLLAKNQENQIQLARELADQINLYIDSQESYVLETCRQIKQKSNYSKI